MTTSPKPVGQFQSKFIRILFRWLSTKIAKWFCSKGQDGHQATKRKKSLNGNSSLTLGPVLMKPDKNGCFDDIVMQFWSGMRSLQILYSCKF